MGIYRKFGIAVLVFFGMFFLYFNLCLVMNITPFPGFLIPDGSNRWSSDYYFGFESVLRAFDQFPDLYLTDIAGVNGSDGYLENFINSLFNVANIFEDFDYAISNWDVIAFLKGIFDIITAPIQAIYYFLRLTFRLLYTFIQFLQFIYLIVAGQFNLEVAPFESGVDSVSGVISLSVSGGIVVW